MKMYIKIIIAVVLLLPLIFFATGLITPMSQKCSWSEYNTYTNLTSATRIFGSCYVPTDHMITLTEKCGFLGFFCRDVEPYNILRRDGVCFRLKDGGRC